MKTLFASLLILGSLVASAAAQAAPATDKPTIVLVHGAFADASSWNGVIEMLRKDGFPVVALANPLRSVSSDAAYVADTVSAIGSPVVLVGHSYGGPVISNAAKGRANVKALVYVAAFAPEEGETVAELSGQFPGSTLGAALAPPVALSGGGADLYVDREKFPAQFADDVPLAQARIMAVTQRPVTDTALNEKSGAPAWKDIPSWSIYGDADRNIPPAAMAFMAKRAASRETVVVPGASHVVMITHPDAVAKLIESAATETK